MELFFVLIATAMLITSYCYGVWFNKSVYDELKIIRNMIEASKDEDWKVQ